MKKKKYFVTFLLALFGLTGLVFFFNSPLFSQKSIGRQPQSVALESHKKLVDSLLPLMESGDFVLRAGKDVISQMLAQTNLTEKVFSHCGIVVRENESPFIYHCSGGEEQPDAVMKKDSAHLWFACADNREAGIFRWLMPEKNKKRLIRYILKRHQEQVIYDLDFDLESDDKLYCSELLYKGLMEALKDSAIIEPFRIGEKKYISLDQLYMNRHVREICRVKFK